MVRRNALLPAVAPAVLAGKRRRRRGRRRRNRGRRNRRRRKRLRVMMRSGGSCGRIASTGQGNLRRNIPLFAVGMTEN